MKAQVFRLGTRKSDLAVTQSKTVADALKQLGVNCELVYLESDGDQDLKTPLYQIEAETPGLFTKNLERALLESRIDLAVHSLKDLPTLQPDELKVGAVLPRASSLDCVIVSDRGLDKKKKFGIAEGSRVGTSSLRREALILSKRPDLIPLPIRGNVPTRVEAVRQGKFDAVVLAAAGLERLRLNLQGVHRIEVDPREFISAPGQGALAVEIRKDSPPALSSALEKLHHLETFQCTSLERKILRKLEGGCTLPLGVHCEVKKGQFYVRAFLGVQAKTGSEKARKWASFQHFDISGVDTETLVANTVAHFQPFRE